MVQKEFQRTNNWMDWLAVWEVNSNEAIAMGLLHTIHIVPYPSATDEVTPDVILAQELTERTRFLLDVARLAKGVSPSTPNEEIGRKACEMAIHAFFPGIGRIKADPHRAQPDAQLFAEIIDYFGGDGWIPYKEPFQSDIASFMTNLWFSLNSGGKKPPFCFKEGELEILKAHEENLIKALVNLRLHKLIQGEGIVKAIPYLKEWIWHNFLNPEIFPSAQSGMVPEYKEEALNQLEDTGSFTFQYLLLRSSETAATLASLILRRDTNFF